MKKHLLILTLGISMIWSNGALSYNHDHGQKKDAKPTVVSQNKAAGCAPATAKLIMEFNDVRALIENGGSMFQDRVNTLASYEVPKSTAEGAVKHFAIFAGALWMGGKDATGQLKLAGLKYRDGTNDFWSGPLTINGGTITADQCIAYDKFYTIRKAEVILFNSWFECDPQNQGKEGVPEIVDQEACNMVMLNPPSNELLNRIINWPAHPTTAGLGQDHYLAPFYDRNNDTDYNPLQNGDYPWYDDIVPNRDDIKCGSGDRRVSLYGDETHWWVFNDKGNIHTETTGEPIGMEIRAQAFCFATDDEVNRMTFYNYELINRGTHTLYNTYFSQFLDADIGNSSDDYTGCDVSRGLGYMFNGDNEDQTNNQSVGYGLNPPAIGCDFFEGPYKDADGNANGFYPDDLDSAILDGGIVYKGIGIGYNDKVVDNERFGMTRFTYFSQGQGVVYPYTDPVNAPQYYNFMDGSWADGSTMVYGGLGYVGSEGATTTPSTYMFPGDSDPLGWATNGAIENGNWTEQTANNPKGDRRFVQSAGSFTLTPGAVNNITVGIVYARGLDGDLFSSVRALKRADTKAQALFDACFKIFDPPMAPKVTIQELENELILMLDNPGTSHNNYKELYDVEDEVNIALDTLENGDSINKHYKFEGYQIFQLKNSESSVADITDPTKAQLVAQCDIKNGVGKLINYEYDESMDVTIPTLKVEGADQGIKHSFSIKEDFFALGDRRLVNHKTYYYVAIAYAHNNYKTYSTAPGGDGLEGQKMPYASSRLGYDGSSIKSVAAIPHNPTPEADGTHQLIGYGSTPRITRLDGYGNGGRSLTLTQASEDFIVENGFMENPTYDYNGGPINVKVVDPLNLADGYFECLFDDGGYDANGTNGADSAMWVINRYSDDGTLIESKTGSVNITQDNEQIIPQWGISVQINQIKYTGTSSDEFTDPIESSIEYADSSKQWLTPIQDENGFNVNNWIRSGDQVDNDADGNPPYTAPACYLDEVGSDPDKKYTGILDGGMAPHRLVGYQCDFMPLAYYGYTTGTAGAMKSYAQISYTPSIDIVFTSDKSKWTRCPVFELGRDASLTEGNAEAGQMRKSASIDKQGYPLGDPRCSVEEASLVADSGMGWFPGYAIDLESGARLFMAYGENSFLGADNGADMKWNPTDNYSDNYGNPILGGQHAFYVFSYKQAVINGNNNIYNFPAYDPNINEVYNLMTNIENNDFAARRKLYGSMTWISNQLLTSGQSVMACDARIKLRVNKEYKNFTATGKNGGKPMYSWRMDDISTVTGSDDRLAEALKMINVVPNPYYAYSEYEGSRLDTRVKITNLPEKCTVSIYSVNGKLIRQFKKDSEITSIDWDLNNHKGIQVAGGVYLIHVDVPGIGEKVLKFYGGMRQIDLHGI